MLALLLAPQFVVAFNNPIMWTSLEHDAPPAAVGLSGYVGITDHHAVRLNYASYEVDNASQLAIGLLDPEAGDGSCAYELSGHSDDVGVGWMYFFRDRWRGPALELGAVRKSMQLGHCMNDASGEYDSTTYTTSTAYVARAVVTWSWTYDRIFLAVGAGASAGREAGTNDTTGARFHHAVAYPETYFRVGFAFL